MIKIRYAEVKDVEDIVALIISILEVCNGAT
ncbi:MAG: hypothetical protein TIS_04408 [Tissierella sp.]